MNVTTIADDLRRRAVKTQEALNGLYVRQRRLAAATRDREIGLAKIKAELAAINPAPNQATPNGRI